MLPLMIMYIQHSTTTKTTVYDCMSTLSNSEQNIRVIYLK